MERDRVVAPSQQRELAERIRDVEVVSVDGDHLVCLSQPEVFAPALVEACVSVARRGRLRFRRFGRGGRLARLQRLRALRARRVAGVVAAAVAVLMAWLSSPLWLVLVAVLVVALWATCRP
jgi:hypothetical protein